ncbi:MAG TPA: branched-chain amino acid ABC transporter permease [Thermoplasmata archaeon]|nr:branched-chain amino acid ABC transporter permease [Thermoplasmata archaeon]
MTEPERGPRLRARGWSAVGRRLLSPFYLAALVVIVVFAFLAQGSPLSFFALSLVFASIYITLALAWDFSSGLTGYVNFGLPFFFGLGAFTAGYLSWYGDRDVPFLLFAAILVGLVGGLLFSVPTLRLRGPYFSLLSLLLPLIAVDFVVTFWTQLKMPTLGYYDLPFLGATPGAELIVLSVANAVLLTVFVLLKESHFGVVLRGIRDDEDAVSSQGIRTFPYKVVAFTVASGVAGFSGATYGMVVTYAGLDGFGFTFLIFPILIVVVGGMGEITGSVLAGYVVILLYQYMFQAFTEITLVVFTAATIVLVLFLPRGILGPLRAFIQFMRTPEGP